MSPGGHPFRMRGILVDGRIRTEGSHPLLDPIMPRVLLALWLLFAPFAALPSPLRWRFPLFIHLVPAPPFHPRFLFRVIRGIIRLGVRPLFENTNTKYFGKGFEMLQVLEEHEVLRMNQEGLVISQGGWVVFVVG